MFDRQRHRTSGGCGRARNPAKSRRMGVAAAEGDGDRRVKCRCLRAELSSPAYMHHVQRCMSRGGPGELGTIWSCYGHLPAPSERIPAVVLLRFFVSSTQHPLSNTVRARPIMENYT